MGADAEVSPVPIDVVFHVPDFDGPARAFGNVWNLLGDDSVTLGTVAVVVNGEALHALFAESDLASEVTELHSAGVRFLACGNTLAHRGASIEDLVEGVEVVPSAMGELARRQAAGAATIRP